MAFLSIVSPVYNTGDVLEEMIKRLSAVLSQITGDYEIILIDDGSTDASWHVMSDLTKNFRFVKADKLSRNFGQHAAIAAGLDLSTGTWVVVMDSDLQDLPESIPQLYGEAEKGYSIVVARRKSRTDAWYRRLVSRIFYF